MNIKNIVGTGIRPFVTAKRTAKYEKINVNKYEVCE